MVKTYKCPVHGEFEHECNMGDGELMTCPKGYIHNNRMENLELHCNKPVTRVFKPTHYSWKCDGFAGKGHD
jgi:hypothetical protein